MNNLKNISIRLEEDTLNKIKLLSKLDTQDKSAILRRAIKLGLKEISTEVAIKGFSEDELSYSEGAKIADMYVGDFMMLLARRGVQVKPYTEDIKKHLEKSEKSLYKIFSEKKKITYNKPKKKTSSKK
jgi:predicted HTH domain antitoxin